jgi:hypothetical protein
MSLHASAPRRTTAKLQKLDMTTGWRGMVGDHRVNRISFPVRTEGSLLSSRALQHIRQNRHERHLWPGGTKKGVPFQTFFPGPGLTPINQCRPLSPPGCLQLPPISPRNPTHVPLAGYRGLQPGGRNPRFARILVAMRNIACGQPEASIGSVLAKPRPIGCCEARGAL